MRIAFLTFEYPGVRPGGIGGYVFKTSSALAQQGHDVHIMTLSLPDSAPWPQGVNVHPVADLADRIETHQLPGALGAAVLNGGVALYKLAVAWLLAEELRKIHASIPFDVVEAAEYEALGLPLMIRPLSGVPVITQIHLASAVNRRGNGDSTVEADELMDALEAAAIVGADGVYAATNAIVRETQRFVPALSGVSVIPYCTPVNVQPYGSAPRKGHVLYVGRLQRRKGVEDIALAAADFLARHPDASIHIAGEDTVRSDQYVSMQSYIKAQVPQQARDRLVFKGEISPADVQAELAGCRFALVPSRVENFAGTAVDALLAGRALIYAGDTGTEEVAGDAGLRVDPASPEQLARAMHELWVDDAKLDLLAARGPERMRQFFSKEKTVSARIQFYQQAKNNYRWRTAKERFATLSSEHMGALVQALSLMTGLCSGANSAISSSPGYALIRIFEHLFANGKEPVIWLFGAGRFTQRLLAERYLWESRGYKIGGIIDDSPRFAGGQSLQGIPVANRNDFKKVHVSQQAHAINVVLSTDTLEAKFWELTEELRKEGMTVLRFSDFPVHG